MSDAYRERARRWLSANVAHHPRVDYDQLMNLAAEFEAIARETTDQELVCGHWNTAEPYTGGWRCTKCGQSWTVQP